MLGYVDDITLAREPASEHVAVHLVIVNDQQTTLLRFHDTLFSTSKCSIFSLSRPNSTGLVS